MLMGYANRENGGRRGRPRFRKVFLKRHPESRSVTHKTEKTTRRLKTLEEAHSSYLIPESETYEEIL